MNTRRGSWKIYRILMVSVPLFLVFYGVSIWAQEAATHGSFSLRSPGVPVDGCVDCRDIREVDFENRIDAVRDSLPGFIEMKNGSHESGFPGYPQSARLESIHYCGQVAVIEMTATWSGGSSSNTGHVRIFRLSNVAQMDRWVLSKENEIDYGWVPGRSIEVDCQDNSVTMYSSDDGIPHRNQMAIARFDLDSFELESTEPTEIRDSEP